MKKLTSACFTLAFVTYASATLGFSQNYWLDNNELAAIKSANQASNRDATLALDFSVDNGCQPNLFLLFNREVSINENGDTRPSEMQIKVDENATRTLTTSAVNNFFRDREAHLALDYDVESLNVEMLEGWKLYLRFQKADADDYSPTLIFNLKNYRTASGNAKRRCLKALDEERKAADVW